MAISAKCSTSDTKKSALLDSKRVSPGGPFVLFAANRTHVRSAQKNFASAALRLRRSRRYLRSAGRKLPRIPWTPRHPDHVLKDQHTISEGQRCPPAPNRQTLRFGSGRRGEYFSPRIPPLAGNKLPAMGASPQTPPHWQALSLQVWIEQHY